MVRRIFISYSFTNRENYRQLHEKLANYFSSKDIQVFAFVFDFQDKVDDKTLMDTAFIEIEKSDILLAEVTDKSVGVGVEVGYAKAKGKKVIYLYQKDSEYQQTIAGTADNVIEYDKASDIINWFETQSIL